MIEMNSLSPWGRTVSSIHKKACVNFWYWIFSSNNLPFLNYFLIFFLLIKPSCSLLKGPLLTDVMSQVLIEVSPAALEK